MSSPAIKHGTIGAHIGKLHLPGNRCFALIHTPLITPPHPYSYTQSTYTLLIHPLYNLPHHTHTPHTHTLHTHTPHTHTLLGKKKIVTFCMCCPEGRLGMSEPPPPPPNGSFSRLFFLQKTLETFSVKS